MRGMLPFFRRGVLILACLRPLCAPAEEPSHEIAEFKARAGSMTAAAISQDGKLVLTGEDDGLVTLWSVATGAAVQKYMGHGRTVFAAALLPDGRRAVTCGDDNRLIVWELATGKRLLEMSTGDSIPVAMSCSPDGALAAAGGFEGGIGIWDLASGKRITTLRRRSTLCGIQFSPDGRLVAAGYADGQTVLWNASDWAPKLTLPATPEGASVGALAFSPDGRLLATGNQHGEAMAWNVADGTKAATFSDPELGAPTPPGSPLFPGGTTTPGDYGAVAFLCTAGPYTLSAGQNFVPKLWETKTGKLVARFPWLGDPHFYAARYGFPYATAVVSARRDLLVTMKENLAQVWRISFAPGK